MDTKVSGYISKQTSPKKEICMKLRSIILHTFPGISEEMKWGVPVYDGGTFYIGAVKHGVNLGVCVTHLTEEDKTVFKGKGSMMRHVKLLSVRDIDEKYITGLLRIVKKD